MLRVIGMNVDYALIGAKIKEKRKAAGMTQEVLAERLSVSVGYVSQVERGVTKISLDLLAQISGILQCDIAYFVTGAATRENGYLQSELAVKYSRLSTSQKKLVLGIIDLIVKEDPNTMA